MFHHRVSKPQNLAHVAHFLGELRAQSGVGFAPNVDRVLDAFGTVRRECHVEAGPWTLISPRYDYARYQTPDADPQHLYHNVLVSLDSQKSINIGEPAFWLRTLLMANIISGYCVMQVGAGTGYYTAILSRLVGDSGSVIAYEIEPKLAALAIRALSDVSNINLRTANALEEPQDVDPKIDLIISFAGINLVPNTWTNRLSSEGRIIAPVTGRRGWGVLVEFKRTPNGFEGTTVGACGFVHCVGARSEATEALVDTALNDRSRLNGWRFKLDSAGRPCI
jgi:protein-L-isoaspartate(D-aspartate) O-methyltransferase